MTDESGPLSDIFNRFEAQMGTEMYAANVRTANSCAVVNEKQAEYLDVKAHTRVMIVIFTAVLALPLYLVLLVFLVKELII